MRRGTRISLLHKVHTSSELSQLGGKRGEQRLSVHFLSPRLLKSIGGSCRTMAHPSVCQHTVGLHIYQCYSFVNTQSSTDDLCKSWGILIIDTKVIKPANVASQIKGRRASKGRVKTGGQGWEWWCRWSSANARPAWCAQ